MNNGTINLDYKKLKRLSHEGDRAGLVDVLQAEVSKYGFEETEETEWAFTRVRSYLADEWTGLSSYIKFRDDQDISQSEIGQLVNILAGGSSPDKTYGKGPRRYVFNKRGGILAALVFFCTTLSPDERRELLDKAS